MQDFKQGQLCLYEKMMLYNEILQHYMDIDDYSNVVKTCRKYSYVVILIQITDAGQKSCALFVGTRACISDRQGP